jgi:hypothetical protein
MNLLRLLWQKEISLSPYRVAEGQEEYRVKREILANIKRGSGDTALEPTVERGSPSLENRNHG